MSLDVSKVRYISLIRLEGGESILSLPYAEMSIDPDLIACGDYLRKNPH
jgi:hypothetical protein